LTALGVLVLFTGSEYYTSYVPRRLKGKLHAPLRAVELMVLHELRVQISATLNKIADQERTDRIVIFPRGVIDVHEQAEREK
jgi:hypothetical protein